MTTADATTDLDDDWVLDVQESRDGLNSLINDFQVDVWVGVGNQQMLGGGVYNSEGEDQTKTANIRRGYSKTCPFVIQYDGIFTQHFHPYLRASQTFKVTYSQNESL